jgi:hypothetical protein
LSPPASDVAIDGYMHVGGEGSTTPRAASQFTSSRSTKLTARDASYDAPERWSYDAVEVVEATARVRADFKGDEREASTDRGYGHAVRENGYAHAATYRGRGNGQTTMAKENGHGRSYEVESLAFESVQIPPERRNERGRRNRTGREKSVTRAHTLHALSNDTACVRSSHSCMCTVCGPVCGSGR